MGTVKYNVLVNEDAGTVKSLGNEGIKNLLEEHELIHSYSCVPIDILLKEAKELIKQDIPLLIGGGDGTILSASKNLKDEKNAFGILPLGTMNLLAQDLNIGKDIYEAIKGYKNGYKSTHMDTAYVNGEPFLCSAAIGAIPKSAQFREEHRDEGTISSIPKLGLYLLKQMDPENSVRLKMSLDGKKQKTIRTSFMVISNNRYENSIKNATNVLHRISLIDGKLAVYTANPKNLFDKIRILFKMRLGGWRGEPTIKEVVSETMRLNSKNENILISLDGETKSLQSPLNFWIQSKSQHFIVPKIHGEE